MVPQNEIFFEMHSVFYYLYFLLLGAATLARNVRILRPSLEANLMGWPFWLRQPRICSSKDCCHKNKLQLFYWLASIFLRLLNSIKRIPLTSVESKNYSLVFFERIRPFYYDPSILVLTTKN